jgi:hypothetical protein
VNTGGNEAEGLFQIAPSTWRKFGGTQYAPTPRLAAPQQQATIAASIFTADPTGGDWGAGLPGREDPTELAAGLGLGLRKKRHGGPAGYQHGGPVPTADVPGHDIYPVPPGSADEPVKPPEGMGPSSDWVPGVVAPGVGPGPGPGAGVEGDEPTLPKWWRDIIEHGGPQGGHLKAPWWWIGSQWGQLPFDPANPPLTPRGRGGPASKLPLDMSGYGKRWHLEIQRANGSREQLPLTLKSRGGGVRNWDAGRVGLRPGDEIQMVKHRR